MGALFALVPLVSALQPSLGGRDADQLLRLRGGYGILAAYNRALLTAPLATNSASAAGLAVVSDSIAQTLARVDRSDGASPWDFERSAWMAAWGGFVSGLVIFFWLQWLGSLFPHARTSVGQLAAKVFVNQMVMSPGLNGGFFAFVIWTRTAPRLVMNAPKWRQLMSKYRADLLPTCIRSCAFWGVVQSINFRVLPPHLGVLFTNAAFVVWTTYLSLVGNRSAKRPATE